MSVITKDTIQPASGQALTIKDEGGTASITVATNGEATFAENIKVTNGKGIDFSAVSGSNSGSASAVLDDYEEGTWEASMIAQTGSVTIDPNYKTGAYTRIGNAVFIQGYFGVTSISNPSGGFQMGGLPFNSKANTQNSDYASFSIFATGFTGAVEGVVSYMAPSVSQFHIQEFNGTQTVDFANHINTSTWIFLSGTYMAD